MELYKIEAPQILELIPDKYLSFAWLSTKTEAKAAYEKANAKYLHWEDLKYKDWIPLELFQTKETFWAFLKMERSIKSRLTPIISAEGKAFTINIDQYAEFLHTIDMEMGGTFMGIPNFTDANKSEFINRNIIEESIASSQIEGANTSRAVAKKMLLEGRKPKNYSELMIFNSHITMKKIEDTFHTEPLSWEMLKTLHQLITNETLPKEKQGVLRETLDEEGNELIIRPWGDNRIAYIAPPKEFVERELFRLIDFANNKDEHAGYIHPLIKAIMLHFWIGLLHPFEDGNGRLARVLFYWYMLRNGYWAFAYISLSERIIKSASQYSMAYIYSEQDDNDLTYFIHYNIEKLKSAREGFIKYITEKIKENQTNFSLLQKKQDLNERQIKLLQHFYQKRDQSTTLKIHQNKYNVAKNTASSDLQKLIEKDFIEKHKQGRNVFYYPTEKIVALFKTIKQITLK